MIFVLLNYVRNLSIFVCGKHVKNYIYIYIIFSIINCPLYVGQEEDCDQLLRNFHQLKEILNRSTGNVYTHNGVLFRCARTRICDVSCEIFQVRNESALYTVCRAM